MKLTGILKDKVDKAETMEAKKDIITEAGMELTDEELEGAAGGRMNSSIYGIAFKSIEVSHNIPNSTKKGAIHELNNMAKASVSYSKDEVKAMLEKNDIRFME